MIYEEITGNICGIMVSEDISLKMWGVLWKVKFQSLV
mgnify:CR=1 FL=1